MFLPDMGSWQGRPEAQGSRRLTLLRMSAFISCPSRNFEGPDKQSTGQLRDKSTEAVVFIKNVYETPRKER